MPLIRFGIQRKADGYWWAGTNHWSVKAAPARWFDTFSEAELCGLRELSDGRSAWRAREIPEEAY